MSLVPIQETTIQSVKNTSYNIGDSIEICPDFTNVSGNIYSLTLTPTIQSFYNNPSGTISGIDIVLRSADSGTQTDDLNISVGAFQLTLTSPNDLITISLLPSHEELSTTMILHFSISNPYSLFYFLVSQNIFDNQL